MEDLQELHALAAREPERAIQRLVALKPQQLEDVVKRQVAANRYAAAQLLADPDREPDPVRRALQISRAQYGLPWWFYEAQYRRMRLS